MSKFALDDFQKSKEQVSTIAAFRKLAPLVVGEWGQLALALTAMLIGSGLNLLGPWLVGYSVDHYIVGHNYGGLVRMAIILVVIYLVSLGAGYVQTITMGSVGTRVLFTLRNKIFGKLQEFPMQFFTQNKAGDLIARINGDAESLNQFFSYQLMQFVGGLVLIIGAGIALLLLDWRIGVTAIVPALVMILFTQVLSPWVRARNRQSRTSLGGLSAEVAESLANFKVVVAFNRQDFFRKRFAGANETTFSSSIRAGMANAVFAPVYSFAAAVGQFAVLALGIYEIQHGQVTIGLLVAALGYLPRFYDPIRQVASIWASLQGALASWDRISPILNMETDLVVVKSEHVTTNEPLLEFKDVSFAFPDGKDVLHDVNFALKRGQKYALVGPTGGGKTTTASLMARLFDPTKGTISFEGKDLRTWQFADRAQRVGFILQEPFLFSGSVRDNILYGNEHLHELKTHELQATLRETGLEELLTRFEGGLEAPANDQLSLGQKQLIAFMRAVLRKPDLLILDEATANVDTLTERQLDNVLKKLPASTTLVIIAHRLNTIKSVDEIFFVNGGTITQAGSMEHAVEMLTHGKRSS